jgi:acyl carrier protein
VNNLEKYNAIFMRSFDIDKTQLGDELVYQSMPSWDSVGHMSLMSELEEAFDVMLDTDDIIDFGSYNIGKDILTKYGVSFE